MQITIRSSTMRLAVTLVCLLPITAIPKSLVFVTLSDYNFNHPHDLTLDPSGRYLYVADVNNNSVKVLDPMSLAVLNTIGKGELRKPHDICFDENGRLLIADSGKNRIVAYKPEGAKAKLLGTIVKGLSSPHGILSNLKGGIYIANTGRHNIIELRNDRIVKRSGNPGRESFNYIRPNDIELSSSGILYITDPGNSRIKLLNSNLEITQILTKNQLSYTEPTSIAFDEHDRLYIADRHNNEILVYDKNFKLVTSLSHYRYKDKQQTFNKPEGLEVREQYLWISDTYNNRILLFKWSEN